MELRKQSTWSSVQPEIFYWRTASGQEVDLVLEDRSGRLVGIEVKASSTLSSNDVRGLQALASAAGRKWVRGVVLYTGTEVIPFANNLHGVLSHTSGPDKRRSSASSARQNSCNGIAFERPGSEPNKPLRRGPAYWPVFSLQARIEIKCSSVRRGGTDGYLYCTLIGPMIPAP